MPSQNALMVLLFVIVMCNVQAYQIGDRVECRNGDEPWLEGIVEVVTPQVRVRQIWTKEIKKYLQVRISTVVHGPVQLDHERGANPLWDDLIDVLAMNNDTEVPGPPNRPSLAYDMAIGKDHARDKLFIDALFKYTPRNVRRQRGKLFARRACLSVARWLIRHHAAGDDLSIQSSFSRGAGLADLLDRLLHHCAYTMAGGGLWAHHQQWALVYHPDLQSSPLYTRPIRQWPELESALQILEEPGSLQLLTQEWQAAKKMDVFHPHAEEIAVSGEWGVAVPKCKGGYDVSEAAAFPETCKLMARFEVALPHCDDTVPEGYKCAQLPLPYVRSFYVQRLRFSTIQGDSMLLKHTAPTNQRLKIHCGIHNPDNAYMRIANQTLVWRRGQCHLFDDSYQHQISTKAGQAPRTIIEIVITHPDLSRSGWSLGQPDLNSVEVYATMVDDTQSDTPAIGHEEL